MIPASSARAITGALLPDCVSELAGDALDGVLGCRELASRLSRGDGVLACSKQRADDLAGQAAVSVTELLLLLGAEVEPVRAAGRDVREYGVQSGFRAVRALPFCCHAPRSALRRLAPFTKKPAVSSGFLRWAVLGSNQ